uniref:Putative helix-turn-helix Fis type n=1 Tax=Sorangium cellulosum So0157-2 TaxID=1254432 RepID=A0A0G2YAW6_SORCE|nr:putative helix-turn-helix Fis type [Sorangium cellulosum So0157-2]
MASLAAPGPLRFAVDEAFGRFVRAVQAPALMAIADHAGRGGGVFADDPASAESRRYRSPRRGADPVDAAKDAKRIHNLPVALRPELLVDGLADLPFNLLPRAAALVELNEALGVASAFSERLPALRDAPRPLHVDGAAAPIAKQRREELCGERASLDGARVGHAACCEEQGGQLSGLAAACALRAGVGARRAGLCARGLTHELVGRCSLEILIQLVERSPHGRIGFILRGRGGGAEALVGSGYRVLKLLGDLRSRGIVDRTGDGGPSIGRRGCHRRLTGPVFDALERIRERDARPRRALHAGRNAVLRSPNLLGDLPIDHVLRDAGDELRRVRRRRSRLVVAARQSKKDQDRAVSWSSHGFLIRSSKRRFWCRRIRVSS